MLPSPLLTLAIFQSDVDALAQAESNTRTRTASSFAARDVRLSRVVADLDFIRAYAQFLVDASPEDAPVIAAKAGMVVTHARNVARSSLRLTKSKTMVHGVDAFAKVTATRQSHYWQYSIDGGRTFIDAGMTSKGRTTLGAFTPGMTVVVRHRSFDRNALGDWGDPVAIIVT
jgi:hypothetical protein